MQKEMFEWVHSWCDEAINEKLPRVLLVGDSITYGYEKIVRERLRGVCYVDFIVMSYSIDRKIYDSIVRAMISDSKYQIVHFNHGLHGHYLSKHAYKCRIVKLLDWIKEQSKVIITTSTHCNVEGNEQPHPLLEKKVFERNEVVLEYADKNGCIVDDLFPISIGMPIEKRNSDGTHYTKEGYEVLAESVVKSIKKQIKELE